ncbi:MAG: HlyD family efflux transporter periplasmic adaptor subunit [Candidatus Nitricoxidivorans perseverans]|uniref:HlyD family efflux transporter periplasmic adaptor subunit n=1 Tax=Candidatus Nitricoxidivorans perseverans TaxID=2975601 RepID=A0AA49FL91_9PROT|nr:MAG: HlyD family efflux transporter periplasmic adaptor subunit [Candidatus Nitricoxidivorans perseverans]
MAEQPLFRAAALGAHKTKWQGDIVLIRPLSYTVLTAVAAFLALVVIAFMVWGTYTKRSTVVGQLLPDTGLVKVYVPQLGIVQEKRAFEGQQVNRGDVLYVLSSERHSGTLGSIQAAISQQVTSRRDSLRDEIAKTRRLQQEDREALVKRIDGIESELRKLDNLLEGQRNRVDLGKDTVARYQGLLDQNYISREQLQQKQEELLDLRARLQTTERERIAVTRELGLRKNELSGLSFKHQNQLAQLERGMSAVDQELAESEGKRQIYITAPESGTVTAVVAEVGQAVDGSRPLASIVPIGANLQAHLYAPSRAVGFVRLGDRVLLRYQAFPYQKFGHAGGKVVSVARTALPANEISNLGGGGGGGQGQQSEPVYRITVELDSQTVAAYGKPQPLQAGMLLEADILQDTRRLYEWVLEPLYSLTGKL